jgi:hypothetical protein
MSVAAPCRRSLAVVAVLVLAPFSTSAAATKRPPTAAPASRTGTAGATSLPSPLAMTKPALAPVAGVAAGAAGATGAAGAAGATGGAQPAPAMAAAAPSGPGPSPQAGDYAWWFPGVGSGGGPARWDPCRTITVSGGPPLTAVALTELSQITGLRFQPVPLGGDIVIRWAPTPGVLALTNASTSNGWIVHADVTLSPASAPRLATILRHELGHALGMAHSRLPVDVMTPGTTATGYGLGDIAGLSRLGTAAGSCLPSATSTGAASATATKSVTSALGWPAPAATMACRLHSGG